MADTKISALSAGTAAPGDEIPVNRSGSNFKITAGDILKINGGTITADSPVLNLTQTWNNAAVTFTGLKFNADGSSSTNSASGSLLMDLQVGGTSRAKVNKIGAYVAGYNATTDWISGNVSFGQRYGFATVQTGTALLNLASTGQVNASGTNVEYQFNGTLVLARDDADTLAQRRTTNAQTFRIYNTYTDSTNTFERGKIAWESNILRIGTEKGVTGGLARALEFQTDGTTRFYVFTNGLMGTGNNSGANAQGLYFNTSGTLRMNSGSANGYFEAALWKWPSTAAVGFVPTTDGNGQNLDAVIKRGGTGILTLGNAGTITDFDRLQFGGTTSSFPALKRSSTTLQARLADDSDYGSLQGKLTTETAYTAGAPTATGYIVLYDSTGTAYKVPAEAL